MNSNDDNLMDWSDENISDSTMHGEATLVVIVFLFCIVIVMAFLYLYDRWNLPRSRSHHIRPTMVFLFPANPSHTDSQGLDPSVVNSLPIFTFSSDTTHRDLIECAVCLSEFEEGESGRVLPGCTHAFHVECIDMWFHSHSTCPLCRSLVEPPATTEAAIITVPPEPGSATEPRSTSGSAG